MKELHIQNIQDAGTYLETLLNTAIDAIITIDESGIIEFVNPATSAIFGYTPSEMIGNNIAMLMPEPYRREHDGYIERYKKTGKAHIIGIGREVKGLQKDGTMFPFRLSVSEMWLGERRVFTGIVHDIREMKKAEEEVRRLNIELEKRVMERTERLADAVNKLLATNSQLQYEIHERKTAEETLLKTQNELQFSLEKEKELSELKSRFVSMTSHEFRTPLSTILSSAALLGRYTSSEQQTERVRHIEKIKSSVNNLTAILNDILSLSKLEEGKVENIPVKFVLQDFCLKIIDDMQGLLKRGQKIIFNAPDTLLEIHQSEHLLRNVLFNLLSNAIKYSNEEKIINFNLEKAENDFLISIQDEGVGIPESEHHLMFDRFYRASNVTNIQGTGLGLNIVKSYLDIMGGTIDFVSEYGKGTTFKITLPR